MTLLGLRTRGFDEDDVKRKRHKLQQYGDIGQTLLIAATFAGSIALSKVLDPSKEAVHDSGLLAWAASIFIASVMGCILIILSVKLEFDVFAIQLETLCVSALITVGFYFLLATSLFSVPYKGAFIFGSVWYFLFVFFTWLSALRFLIGRPY
jgi:hypothetical protein